MGSKECDLNSFKGISFNCVLTFQRLNKKCFQKTFPYFFKLKTKIICFIVKQARLNRISNIYYQIQNRFIKLDFEASNKNNNDE